MKKIVWLTTILMVIFTSTACSGVHRLAGGDKADQAEWLAKMKQQQENAEKTEQVAQVERLKKQEQKESEYRLSHPEVAVTNLGDGISNNKIAYLRSALNNFPFVTREPGTGDPNKIYANVGDYRLTLSRMMISFGDQANDCKKIAAYSGYDVKDACYNQIAKGLNDFAKVIRDKSTPDLTKKAAIGEATFGSVIDFEHAARLVEMHNQLCAQQGNVGYVSMVTVSAPCKSSVR